jgi:hypothetical protein
MRNRIPEDAFDYYLGLGAGRTYVAVATHFKVSVRGVTKRALKDGWQERIAKIEAAARNKADEKAAESLEAINDRHLKMLRAIQAKALQGLQRLPLDNAMDCVRALDLAIRQERVVIGEPGDRTEVSVEDIVRKEYERWMVPEAPVGAPARSEADHHAA